MADRWIEAVRGSGELGVHAGPSFAGGPWAPTLNEALRTLNGICGRLALGVRLTTCAMSAREAGGADVEVEAAWDKISYVAGTTIRSQPFNGRGSKAVTVSVPASGSGLVQKAFIFVPAVPKAPESNRTMGPGARLVLLAHELLHAMGAEHSTDDIMQSEKKLQLQLGTTYVEDRVWIMTPAGPRLMPPLFISGTTTDAIRTAWAPA